MRVSGCVSVCFMCVCLCVCDCVCVYVFSSVCVFEFVLMCRDVYFIVIGCATRLTLSYLSYSTRFVSHFVKLIENSPPPPSSSPFHLLNIYKTFFKST